MRINKLLRVFVLLLFTSCVFITYAQTALPCGNYKIDQAALKKALDYESKNIARAPSVSILLRVYFHILSCDDGTLTAATAAQISSEFNILAAAYTADNICFINAGLDYIDNTKLDSNFNASTDAASLFSPYNVPNCLNIYYTDKIKGTNSSCAGTCGIGGVTLSIPDTFCLVAKSNIGAGQSIAHEVGHCLGLLHTFQTPYEDIDGSNSLTAGDLIGDTPADPYAYIGQSCFATSSNGCTYSGTCKDPKNASNFSPPYSNLMTYWWNGSSGACYTSLALTTGQFTRANSFLNTYSGLINCESPASVTESNINISSGYLMASATGTLTANGNVIISAGAISTLGGTEVFLEPGFDAKPTGSGQTTIITPACGSSPGLMITSSKQKTNVDAVEIFPDKLTSYPNPASTSVNLVFNINDEVNNAMIAVYNVNAQRVKEISLGNLIAGKHTVTLDISKFAGGIYSVVLQLPYSIMRTTVIKIK